MSLELIDIGTNNEIVNTKETVVSELAKCYLRLMDLVGSKDERISGLLPLMSKEEGRELAVSIVEREYRSSESFAVFIYEIVEPSLLHRGFKAELADGREATIHLVDLLFSNKCDYDTLHELCAMIDTSLDDYYANNLFCDR